MKNICNKKDLHTFFTYRYFLVPKDQISFSNLDSDLDLDRKTLLYELLENQLPIELLIDKSKLKMYLYHKCSDDIFICKLGKCTEEIMCEDNQNDFEDKIFYNYPYIYIVFCISRQIILIESKSSVFKNKLISSDKLNKYLTSILNDNDFEFYMDEITSPTEFWNIVESEDIYNLKLNIKSPNLFRGDTKVDDLAREWKSITNTTETTLEFKNNDGKLQVKKSFFNSFIEYITCGGGSWSLRSKSGSKSSTKLEGTKVVLDNINNLEAQDKNISSQLESVLSDIDCRPGDGVCEKNPV
ncbi:MAG: hypothetical protein ACRDC3_12180 [Paraclostridium dentum]|uniref:hypothetical protein n=1 Tax=Paraclostridium dentum TaxID=2662455 RepID=UPI003EE49E4E